MEPIVAVLRIDEFVLGSNPAPRTWPTGTVLKILPRFDARGNPIFRSTGEREIAAVPICCAEANGVAAGNLPTYTLTTEAANNLPFGRFIHAPNCTERRYGNENVIYFTPPIPRPDYNGETALTGVRFVILAEPITGGGPGDVVLKSNITYGGASVNSCGPKYISAAVGGVVALDWDTEKYPNTLKNDNTKLKIAYAGSPAYIKMEIDAGVAQQTAETRVVAFDNEIAVLTQRLAVRVELERVANAAVREAERLTLAAAAPAADAAAQEAAAGARATASAAIRARDANRDTRGGLNARIRTVTETRNVAAAAAGVPTV